MPRSQTDLAGPAIARIVQGGLCGACLCISAGRSAGLGALLVGLGGLIGAFGVYRRALVWCGP